MVEVSTSLHRLARAVLLRNADVTQSRILRYMKEAAFVWPWTRSAVPGELQTRAWTEAMLASDDDGTDPGPSWWAPREARIALLDDPNRQWRFLIVGSRAVHAGVVEHIAALSERDHIEVAVIDQSTPKSLVAPETFHVYGARRPRSTALWGRRSLRTPTTPRCRASTSNSGSMPSTETTPVRCSAGSRGGVRR